LLRSNHPFKGLKIKCTLLIKKNKDDKAKIRNTPNLKCKSKKISTIEMISKYPKKANVENKSFITTLIYI